MINKSAIVLLVLILALFCFQPAMAGGPARDVLFNQFCKSMPYHNKIGCNGYLQYRIQRGKSRDQSLNNCIWGCGQVLSDPSAIEKCKEGCRAMHGYDN